MNDVSTTDTVGIWTRGPLVLNIAERTLHRDGVRVPLTGAMYKLLEALVMANGRDLSAETAYVHALGRRPHGEDRALAVLVCGLRKRVGPEVDIRTVWGRGYWMAAWS